MRSGRIAISTMAARARADLAAAKAIAGRKPALALILGASLALAGCASSNTFGGRRFEPYGLLSASKKSPAACYEISAAAVIFSIILIETVIFPVYVIGWALFEPARLKVGPNDTCGAA